MTQATFTDGVIARFHEDPAHGWLEVNYCHLEELGIAHRISKYSYRNGDTVYLEEDGDMGIFWEAAHKADWNISLDRIYHRGMAPLRQFAAYRRNAQQR